MIARLAAAIAAALLLAACGGDGDGGRWDTSVEATREAVEAGDRQAALASLQQIEADARRAHAEGDVSDEELFELTALVEQARAQVDDALPAPTTTTPPTTAPPETAPPVVEQHEDDDDDKPGRKGKGRGGDDGDDD